MRPKDGGPAFPRPAGHIPPEQHDCHPEQEGMTLRQWYAGMAMAQMLTADYVKIMAEVIKSEKRPDISVHQLTAASAFQYADAMLAHEEKEKEATHAPR